MKPGIVGMTLVMAAGGIYLAPLPLDPLRALTAMLAIGLGVGSANALNMYIERDSDGLMARTKDRPLPAKRLSPTAALTFGLTIGALSVALCWFFANPLTAIVGFLSLFSYVCIYTPLKRITPWALVIGAIPGAAPPLLGWTAAANNLDAPGIVLFLILLVWQLPHFLAIAIYLKDDYARAGIRVTPLVHGDDIARRQVLIYATALIPVSLLLVPLGIAGPIYAATALAAGTWFLARCLRGYRTMAVNRWARAVFLASLVYLPVLTVGLVLDVAIL